MKMTTYLREYTIQRVRYHSYEWSVLVETGWVTWVVEDDIATMYWKGDK